MAKLTLHQKLQSVLSQRLYQTPEDITSRIFLRYGLYWKTSNTERRLREMAAKGMVENKPYKNTHNNSYHKRWRKSEVITNA